MTFPGGFLYLGVRGGLLVGFLKGTRFAMQVKGSSVNTGFSWKMF